MNLVALVNEHPGTSRALYERGRWWSWGEVRRHSDRVSKQLRDLGVRPGDRVAMAWPTSSDFVLAYLGTLAAGAVAVPLNPNSPAPELAGQLRLVRAAVLLAGGAAAEVATEVPGLSGEASEAPSYPPLVVRTELVGAEPDETHPAPSHDGEEAGGPRLEVAERDDGDLAVLLFTSGTAGAPRAAMLSHGNLRSNLDQMLGIPQMVEPDDVCLAAVPLFHVFGLNVALGLCLATGAALVLEERFDAAESLELTERLGVTTLVGVPAMFAAWAEMDDGSGERPLRSVRRAMAGAAALPAEVARRFESRYGVPLWQGYGLTEASPGVATSLGGGRHDPASVGRPLPGVELRIVDESGEQVLQGDPGEIWVKGPNVFRGYWEDPAATAEVLTGEGWLRTGDVGVIGEDGDLYIVDRKKDLVIVSGFNVYPAEVERVVARVPGVAAVAVIGRPDPLTGEAIEAVVVRERGSSVSESEVREACSARLARYKCPSRVRFVAEMPTGLAGKALRRALREQGP